jgi:hypothetical protein
MTLVIDSRGGCRCIYGEQINLKVLGEPKITRASFVEPDGQGRWWADCSPLVGPKLGPFDTRSEALAAEVAWITTDVLHG